MALPPPGKAGEAALQEKLDKIRGDYLALVERVKTENVKAASDLEKKFLKDEEDFKKKQVGLVVGAVQCIGFQWCGVVNSILNRRKTERSLRRG